MAEVIIDGKKIAVEENTTLLEAAKKIGIYIPTLCYHEALKPYGACRVCLVEIIEGAKSGLTTSCSHPVSDGLVVKTNSERAIRARRMVVELLLARSPEAKKIKELAQRVGITIPRARKDNNKEKCILCGLCVRLCERVIGRSAISFINRGKERKVETPFKIHSETCIGCGACAFICPTGAIEVEDVRGKKVLAMWHTELPLKKCASCSRYFVPKVELDFLKEKIEIPDEIFNVCQDCRRKILKNKLKEIKLKG